MMRDPEDQKQNPSVELESSNDEKVVQEKEELEKSLTAVNKQEEGADSDSEDVRESQNEDFNEEIQEEASKQEEETEEEDFSDYSKKGLLSRLKELVYDDNPLKVNRKIQDIKKYFEIFLENEHRVALQKFVEKGNSEVDFKPKPDPVKDEFFSIFNEYKKRRNAYIQKLNEEKAQNLKAKREILDKMKHITENMETVENGYHEFKKLQGEWRKIGHVPKKDLDNLRKSYQFYVNKFYDNQSIYAEFKALDRKKNQESKLEICRKLEDLAYSSDLSEIKKESRRLEDEWHQIGPVPREEGEKILNRFNKALADVEKQRQDLEEAREREREKNLEAKEAIIAKIRDLESFESERPKDWIQKNEELEDLIKQWRSIGFVPYHKKDEVASAFREAVRIFNHKKNQFFKRKKKERSENIQQKQAIIDRVRELLEAEDFKAAKNEVLDLQKQWKGIGSIPAKESEKLWKKFRELCDQFFDKLGEYYKEKEKEEQKNLEHKKALCARIENAANEGVSDPESAVKNYEKEWHEIGYVPIKEKDKIRKRFDEARKKLLQNVEDQVETSPELINFRIKVDGWKEQNKTNQLKSEERKLSKKLKENREEINLIENNIQLFSQSPNAQKMVNEYRQKIDHLKKEIELIRQKLDLINH